MKLSAVQSDPRTWLPFVSWCRPCSKHYRSTSLSGCLKLLQHGENSVNEKGWNKDFSRACWVTLVWRLWLVGALKQHSTFQRAAQCHLGSGWQLPLGPTTGIRRQGDDFQWPPVSDSNVYTFLVFFFRFFRASFLPLLHLCLFPAFSVAQQDWLDFLCSQGLCKKLTPGSQ